MAMSAACHQAKGVIQKSAAPSNEASSTPPTKPSTVLEGESTGAILRLPKSLPQTYCSTSELCTTRMSQLMSSRLLF